jgi:DNA mismatch endonuclease (patch repair protein)
MHDAQCVMEGSECCKIPKTNRDFWVAKICRNKERDKEEQRRLAEMGWHCITVWECELRPSRREETLESLAFTLNHIYLQDHSVCKPYEVQEDTETWMVAEE